MTKYWWTVWIKVAVMAAVLIVAYNFISGIVRDLFDPYLLEESETVVAPSEETEEEDLDRAVQTVYAVIPKRYTPPGGFIRGMEIRTADGGRCRVLTPVLCGGYWSIKCSRVWL